MRLLYVGRYKHIYLKLNVQLSTNSVQVPDLLFCINNEIIVYTENLGTYTYICDKQ